MKKKRKKNMFPPILSISNISKKLLLFGAFLMLCFSGYGQTVTISDVSGAEDDGAITVTATLDIAVAGGFSLEVSTTDGSATILDSDYTAVVSQVLNFAGTAGETQQFTVTPTVDTKLEIDEDLTVSMGNLGGTIALVDITDTATVTINNDDSATATITATDDTATEAGTTNNGTFTVDLGLVNATGSAIVVNFTRSGTATHVTDYANIGTSVSIANGQQTGTVTIDPVDDT